jgi:hypothetical protein
MSSQKRTYSAQNTELTNKRRGRWARTCARGERRGHGNAPTRTDGVAVAAVWQWRLAAGSWQGSSDFGPSGSWVLGVHCLALSGR